MPSRLSRNLFSAGMCLVLLSLTLPLNLQAQGGATGAISGTVQDTSGAVILNAKVGLVSASRGELIRTESTNSSGLFTFNLLPAGTYTVQVNAPSFAQTLLLDVAVRKGKAQVPPYSQQDDLRLKLTPFE